MSDGGPSEGTFEGYKQGEDISLSSYGVLAGAFNLIFGVFLLAAQACRQAHTRTRRR